MIHDVVILIVMMPLTAALMAPLVGRQSASAARWLTLLTLGATCAAALVALRVCLDAGPLHYALAGWTPPWGIEFVVDPLSGMIATLVSALALLVALHGAPTPQQPGGGVYWALYLLLVAGLLGIALTGDLFNLFVFLEISALAGYALLGAHDIRSRIASFRYLLVGTLAGSFYLLGVGYLYALTGTLNMADMAERLPHVQDARGVAVAVGLITVGLATKSALFPLHGWLPDAYSYAPPALVAFISAVASKVSAYALFRILYFTLGATGPAAAPLELMGWAAAIAVLAGSAMALAQQDFRRMLAFSSVSQMGYIFLGFAIGNAAALTGALLHIVNHAVMKGGLFLIAGTIFSRKGRCRISDFEGFAKDRPMVAVALTVTSLSMVGLPPSAGFFSKYYLALGAIQSGKWPLLAALVASTLLGLVYFLRVLEQVYFAPSSEKKTPVLPAHRWIPIATLAAAALLLGLFNQSLVSGVIQFALPAGIR